MPPSPGVFWRVRSVRRYLLLVWALLFFLCARTTFLCYYSSHLVLYIRRLAPRMYPHTFCVSESRHSAISSIVGVRGCWYFLLFGCCLWGFNFFLLSGVWYRMMVFFFWWVFFFGVDFRVTRQVPCRFFSSFSLMASMWTWTVWFRTQTATIAFLFRRMVEY